MYSATLERAGWSKRVLAIRYQNNAAMSDGTRHGEGSIYQGENFRIDTVPVQGGMRLRL